MLAKIEPHWDKIAEGTGLKNKKSARDTWYQFKKKLEKASGKPIGSPSTPKKRKAGETEGEGTDSPSKEKTARKLRKDKQVEDDGAAAAQAEDGVKQEEDGN